MECAVGLPANDSVTDESERMIVSTPTAAVVPHLARAAALSSASAKKRRARRALMVATVFCFFFTVLEIGGGVYAHSIALVNDGAHQLIDVANLGLSLLALQASGWASSGKYTFGWKRAEVVGALASVFTIWGIIAFILIEAGEKTHAIILCARGDSDVTCESIDVKVMIGVGAAGTVANGLCALILAWGGHSHSHGLAGVGGGSCTHAHGCSSHDHNHDHAHDHDHSHAHEATDLNLRSGFVHMATDCVQSLGVVVAAGIIWYFNDREFGVPHHPRSLYNLADPICSVVFALLMMWGTVAIFRDLFRILMQGTPPHLCRDALREEIGALPGVIEVEDLHVWALDSSAAVLTAHLVVDDDASAVAMVDAATAVCRRAGITYSTIQVNAAPTAAGEARRCPCLDPPGW